MCAVSLEIQKQGDHGEESTWPTEEEGVWGSRKGHYDFCSYMHISGHTLA